MPNKPMPKPCILDKTDNCWEFPLGSKNCSSKTIGFSCITSGAPADIAGMYMGENNIYTTQGTRLVRTDAAHGETSLTHDWFYNTNILKGEDTILNMINSCPIAMTLAQLSSNNNLLANNYDFWKPGDPLPLGIEPKESSKSINRGLWQLSHDKFKLPISHYYGMSVTNTNTNNKYTVVGVDNSTAICNDNTANACDKVFSKAQNIENTLGPQQSYNVFNLTNQGKDWSKLYAYTDKNLANSRETTCKTKIQNCQTYAEQELLFVLASDPDIKSYTMYQYPSWVQWPTEPWVVSGKSAYGSQAGFALEDKYRLDKDNKLLRLNSFIPQKILAQPALLKIKKDKASQITSKNAGGPIADATFAVDNPPAQSGSSMYIKKLKNGYTLVIDYGLIQKRPGCRSWILDPDVKPPTITITPSSSSQNPWNIHHWGKDASSHWWCDPNIVTQYTSMVKSNSSEYSIYNNDGGDLLFKKSPNTKKVRQVYIVKDPSDMPIILSLLRAPYTSSCCGGALPPAKTLDELVVRIEKISKMSCSKYKKKSGFFSSKWLFIIFLFPWSLIIPGLNKKSGALIIFLIIVNIILWLLFFTNIYICNTKLHKKVKRKGGLLSVLLPLCFIGA